MVLIQNQTQTPVGFSAYAADFPQGGVRDESTAWQSINSIVTRYEEANSSIHRWNAISATTKNPSSVTMPITAILGNGHVGVTSKNTETEKSYILSSTDFWSDNTKEWGYANRSPQIAIGGELVIAGKQAVNTTSFSEYQNILDAEIYTNRELGGLPVEITTWMAPYSDIIVTEITSKGGANLPLEIKPKGADNRTQYLPVHAGVADGVVWGSRSTNINPETRNNENTVARWVSEFVIASKVLGGSNHSYSSDASQGILGVDIAPGETIYVVTAAHTEAQQAITAPVGETGLGVASAVDMLTAYTNIQSVEALKTENTEWWKDFYQRSWVDMGDNGLNRGYYDSQYIFGSSSRDGAVASGLYGVWITNDVVKWQGDYHLNYNFQAPYYGAYSSNRINDIQPQFDVYLNWMDEGIGIAGDYTRLRGIMNWYVDSRADLAGGIPDALLYPVSFKQPRRSGYGPSHGQTINALFCASQIITYYRYTQDLDWLLTKQESWEGNWYSPYDFLAKTANFYEGWVEKRGPREFTQAEIDSGYYEKNSINNKTSGDSNATPTQAQFTANYGRYPAYNEGVHGDDYVYIIADSAHEGGFEINPTVTVGNVQNLLKCLLEIGPEVAQSYSGTYGPTGETVEGIYQNKFAVWQDMTDHMADYMEGAIYPYEGRAAAYKGLDIFGLSEDRWIRHLSATVNLEFIHPGYELGFDSDPRMLEVGRNSVKVMGYGASPGWGQINNTAKIFTHGARVGYDTTDLIACIKASVVNKMQSNGHVNDGSHGWEKSGVTETLNTLMVAESGGIIKVFPYWKDASAEFHSIRMPGAFLVSSASKNGNVGRVDITSEKGGTLNLVVPWDSELWDTKVLDFDEQPVATVGEFDTANSGDRYISIDTTAGDSYSLVRIPKDGCVPLQPLDLVFEGISSSSVSLAWQRNPAEADTVGYEVRYNPINEPANQEVVTTENTEATIDGLQPETMYKFTVYAFFKYAPDSYSLEGSTLNVPTAPSAGTKDIILMMDTLQFDIIELGIGTADETALLNLLPPTMPAWVYDFASNATVKKDLVVNWDVSSVQYDTTHTQTILGVFSTESQVENPYMYRPSASLRLHDSAVAFISSEKQTLHGKLDITTMENVVDWNMIHHLADGPIQKGEMNNSELIGTMSSNVANSNSPDFWTPVKFDNGGNPASLDELALNKGNAQGRSAAYFARGVDSYFEFEVDAQPFEQELIVVIGGNRSISELSASFDTNNVSASATMATNVAANKVTSMPSGAHNDNKGGQNYIIRFSSSEVGQKLRVRLTLITDLAPSNGQILFKGSVLRQIGTPTVEISDLLKNGQIEFSPANPNVGELITVTYTPDVGYLYVDQSLSLNGNALLANGSGEYTFVMPYGAALLYADFKSETQDAEEELKSVMAKADLLDEQKYTVASWIVMRQAYTGAETLLQSGSATVAQLTQAADTLTTAIDALELAAGTTVDKTALGSLLTLADGKQQSLYTPQSWTTFAQARTDSRVIYDSQNATQVEVDNAAQALTTAMDALEFVTGTTVDKTALGNLLTLADSKQQSLYTPQSWTAFVQTRTDSRVVYDSQTLHPTGTHFKVNWNYTDYNPKATGSQLIAGRVVIPANISATNPTVNITVVVGTPQTYQITVDAAVQNGTLSSSHPSATEYTLVTLTAQPAAGYQLKKLTVNGVAVTVNSNYEHLLELKENISVSAVFEVIPPIPTIYTVTIDGAIVDGTVTTSATSEDENTEIVLTVVPAAGYRLKTLSIDGSPVIPEADLTYRFLLLSSVVVSAVFEIIPINYYSVLIDPALVGGSIATSHTTAPSGTTVTITAQPNAGYKLKTLTVNGAVVAPDSSLSYSFNLTADTTVTAVFEIIPINYYSVLIDPALVGGSIATSHTTAPSGTTVTITAQPNAGYVLDAIFINGIKVSPTSGLKHSFLLNDNVTVSATFSKTVTPSKVTPTVTSSGRGGGSSSQDKTSVPQLQALSATQAKKTIVQSLLANKTVPTVDIIIKSVPVLTPELIQLILDSKAESQEVRVLADSMKGNKVVGRLYLPMNSLKQGASINTTISTNIPETAKVSALFKKFFANDFFVVNLAQKGEFGAVIRVAVINELANVDAKNIVVYSYDIATNKYVQVQNANPTIDNNGYVHFNTTTGGTLIISNGSLLKK